LPGEHDLAALLAMVPANFSTQASGAADNDENYSLGHVYFSVWDPIVFA